MDTKGIPSDNPYEKPEFCLGQVDFQSILGPFYACAVEVEGVYFLILLCCQVHLLLILQGSVFAPENIKTQLRAIPYLTM